MPSPQKKVWILAFLRLDNLESHFITIQSCSLDLVWVLIVFRPNYEMIAEDYYYIKINFVHWQAWGLHKTESTVDVWNVCNWWSSGIWRCCPEIWRNFKNQIEMDLSRSENVVREFNDTDGDCKDASDPGVPCALLASLQKLDLFGTRIFHLQINQFPSGPNVNLTLSIFPFTSILYSYAKCRWVWLKSLHHRNNELTDRSTHRPLWQRDSLRRQPKIEFGAEFKLVRVIWSLVPKVKECCFRRSHFPSLTFQIPVCSLVLFLPAGTNHPDQVLRDFSPLMVAILLAIQTGNYFVIVTSPVFLGPVHSISEAFSFNEVFMSVGVFYSNLLAVTNLCWRMWSSRSHQQSPNLQIPDEVTYLLGHT